MERLLSPAVQYKSKKCLTRLCKRYGSKPGYQLDENLTLTDDWDQVKPHLKRPAEGRAATAERAAAAWSQIMRRGDKVNLFLDLDDRLPSLEEAKAKTYEMVEWAKTDLPPLLGKTAAEIYAVLRPGGRLVCVVGVQPGLAQYLKGPGLRWRVSYKTVATVGLSQSTRSRSRWRTSNQSRRRQCTSRCRRHHR